MPWLTVKIRVKTDGVRKGGAGGTVTRLCVELIKYIDIVTSNHKRAQSTPWKILALCYLTSHLSSAFVIPSRRNNNIVHSFVITQQSASKQPQEEDAKLKDTSSSRDLEEDYLLLLHIFEDSLSGWQRR